MHIDSGRAPDMKGTGDPCKQGSVTLIERGDHSSQRRNPGDITTSSCRTVSRSSPYLVLHEPRFTKPARLPPPLVGSYPTVSPSLRLRSPSSGATDRSRCLTACRVEARREFPATPKLEERRRRSLLSVALSLGRPRLSLTAGMLSRAPTFLHHRATEGSTVTAITRRSPVPACELA